MEDWLGKTVGKGESDLALLLDTFLFLFLPSSMTDGQDLVVTREPSLYITGKPSSEVTKLPVDELVMWPVEFVTSGVSLKSVTIQSP